MIMLASWESALFPVEVVDVDVWPVLPIEYGICTLVIPARRHVVAIIEID